MIICNICSIQQSNMLEDTENHLCNWCLGIIEEDFKKEIINKRNEQRKRWEDERGNKKKILEKMESLQKELDK